MKVIILADGKNQILPLEGGLKCLSKINNDIALDKLIKNIRECGINDISVIVGYNYKDIENQTVKKYYNPDWFYTNEIKAVCCAKKELNDDIIILLGNLILDKEIINQIIEKEGKIVALRKNRKFFGVIKLEKELCLKILDIENKNFDLRKGIIALARLKKKRVKIKMVDTNDKQELFKLDSYADIKEIQNLYKKEDK